MTDTYILDRGERIIVPANAYQLQAEGSRGRVRICSALLDQSKPSPDHAHQGHLEVTRIDSPTVIVVFPGDGSAVFREGTVVTLFVETSSTVQAVDPIRVEVIQQDVSGLHRAELIRMSPAGNQIEVSARRLDDLGPLAEAACRIAHELLGAGQAEPVPAPAIGISVDATTSMTSRLTDGSLSVLTDLVTGVTRAAACDLSSVRILGHTPLLVPVDPIGSLSERIDTVWRQSGSGIGLTTRNQLPRNDKRLDVVITDTPWSDRDAATTAARHLVLAPSTPQSPSPGCTRVDPEQLTSLSDTDPDEATLRQLVHQLLAALTVETKETRP